MAHIAVVAVVRRDFLLLEDHGDARRDQDGDCTVSYLDEADKARAG